MKMMGLVFVCLFSFLSFVLSMKVNFFIFLCPKPHSVWTQTYDRDGEVRENEPLHRMIETRSLYSRDSMS